MTIIIIPISARRKHNNLWVRWVSLWSVDHTQISGKLALMEYAWCNANHCFQSVRVLVRRKRHSLGITMCWPLYTELLSHPMFWGKRLMKISLEMFIYDIPTRPKVMFGQLKCMKFAHANSWDPSAIGERNMRQRSCTWYIWWNITFLESEIYYWW